ncbi:ExbD/TolR family protein [Marinobacter caseinilyticus]|uniref:ExbD/TolR family protein n=1 Tax=Marinobacter caseinilyticus TaxID=2692195 RepID=UPI00140E0499|nr:biopolymer transporter ExbD [Marinobacter caseinilyticus]
MRRKHRKMQSNPELDITAFMNLMIVLVPVLLLGMVFSQVRMIDLNFPGMSAGDPPNVDSFQLAVTLVPAGLTVTDGERGLIRQLPLKDGNHNLSGLRDVLMTIKQRMPDKTDLVLEVGGDVDYQTLVEVMDTARSYRTVVAASVIEAELFPDVSLANAPEEGKVHVQELGKVL